MHGEHSDVLLRNRHCQHGTGLEGGRNHERHQLSCCVPRSGDVGENGGGVQVEFDRRSPERRRLIKGQFHIDCLVHRGVGLRECKLGQHRALVLRNAVEVVDVHLRVLEHVALVVKTEHSWSNLFEAGVRVAPRADALVSCPVEGVPGLAIFVGSIGEN